MAPVLGDVHLMDDALVMRTTNQEAHEGRSCQGHWLINAVREGVETAIVVVAEETAVDDGVLVANDNEVEARWRVDNQVVVEGEDARVLSVT